MNAVIRRCQAEGTHRVWEQSPFALRCDVVFEVADWLLREEMKRLRCNAEEAVYTLYRMVRR
jgi:hypothetical protein